MISTFESVNDRVFVSALSAGSVLFPGFGVEEIIYVFLLHISK